jgi:transposase
MEITAEQFARIESFLPRQRGNVSHENLAVVNAILYVAENGCKWRACRCGLATGMRSTCV